jgi:hypothetical protein
VNATLGIVQMWGGKGLGIAEVMSPGGDAAVEVLDESDATTTLFICNTCFLQKDINLAEIAERRGHARKNIAQKVQNVTEDR